MIVLVGAVDAYMKEIKLVMKASIELVTLGPRNMGPQDKA